MTLRMRKTFAIFTPGTSFRRRVAYSFAIVRLVLAPVILLAVYYLFQMGWIVDRIVSVDAPAATMAQQASTLMQAARRAEQDVSGRARALCGITAAQVMGGDLLVDGISRDMLIEVPARRLVGAEAARACRIPLVGAGGGHFQCGQVPEQGA